LKFKLFANNISLQSHLNLYDINGTQIFSTAPPTFFNVTSNSEFFYDQLLTLPPGKIFLAKLYGFYAKEYSAALFDVSPFVLYAYYRN